MVELLESLTVKPPAGAGPVKVTVPVEFAPPVSDAGLRLTDKTVAGFTVRATDCDRP